MAWDHDTLAHDLAMHLRAGGKRLVWCNIFLGERGSPRPDVFSLIPFSWARPEITAYEVKVSKADLRADLTAGKWQGYLPNAECVTFAVPQGLATKADIPPTCGLMLRSERGWRTARKGIRGVAEMNRVLSLKLIALAPAWRDTDSWAALADHERRYLESQAKREALQRAGHALSRDIAEILRLKVEDRGHGERKAREIIEEAKRFRDGIEAEAAALCRAIGIEPGAGNWAIARKVKERAALLAGGAEALGVLTRACDRAAKALEEGKLLAEMAAADSPGNGAADSLDVPASEEKARSPEQAVGAAS